MRVGAPLIRVWRDMAENPATWGTAEHIVSKVLDDHFDHSHKVIAGEEEPVIGLSLVRQITDALRAAGFLPHDDPHESCPWCHGK